MEGLILKSVDGGKHWKIVLQPSAGPYFHSLTQDPADPRHVTVAGTPNRPLPSIKIYESYDTGEIWAPLPDIADVFAGERYQVVFDDQSNLYIGTDRGVYQLVEASYHAWLAVIAK
jgi:photosystem II stability/assembly factor-like uncharacterized protein